MDRLQAMQTFVRVVESGSFSAAAREQDSTQSAISKQIAALERHLGARLLTRTTRSIALTDDGARYFEEARRLVGEIADAESRLRNGEQQLEGWLRVATSVGFGLRVLMPHVQSFLAAHPRLRIDFKLSDGVIDLIEHGVDLAVRIGELPDSSLVARRIGSARRIVLASPAYLAKRMPGQQPPATPEELQQHDCIVYTGLSTRNQWHFRSPGGEMLAVRVEGPLQTDNSEVVRAAVLAGMGIAQAHCWLFRDALASGAVLPLLSDWQTPALPIHVVTPPHRRHAAKVKAFADHLARGLSDDSQCTQRKRQGRPAPLILQHAAPPYADQLVQPIA